MSQSEESQDENCVFPFLINSLTNGRGQIQCCQNLIANLFEQGNSPCKTEFPEVKIKRQIIDHYLKGKCNIAQQYGIYSIEISSPSTFHGKYQIQKDDVDKELSKVFKEHLKNIQHQNSQRANSKFTNDVFAILYTYLSILEKSEIQSILPGQISRHTTVRIEIAPFSEFLNAIHENLTSNEFS